MRRLGYLPLLLAVTFLPACDRVSDDEDGGIPTGNLISLFEPTAGTIPFPNDALFAGFTTPTLNIPQQAPPVLAANETDGFSTTANIFTDFIGFVDFETTQGGVIVIEVPAGAQPRVLVEGQDYAVGDYPATMPIPNTGEPPIIAPVNTFRTRLVISPLKPLRPGTQHIVVITDTLRDTSNNLAAPSTQWRIVRRATPVSEQDDPTVLGMSPAAVATLEGLQQQLVQPTLAGVEAITGLNRERIVLAWPFTTQSIGAALNHIAANAEDRAETLGIVAGFAEMDLGALGAPNVADIFVGAVDLPYYLDAPTIGVPEQTILSTFWHADPEQPDRDAPPFLGQVPCLAFAAQQMGLAPSTSTTRCFPVPVERHVERARLLITVPSIMQAPQQGWPVVIFQHGITSDRTAMLGLAPILSAAGFVTVAMDLPLHGIPRRTCSMEDGQTCIFRQALRATETNFPGTRERTFDVDLDNDEQQDSSGAHFINLQSLLTSRDNLRQGVADLLHLRAMLPQLAASGIPVNPDRIHFVGHSLGGIVGSLFLALDEAVGAATVAMPGGGIAKLLDGSASFGPVVGAGLGAAGVQEGSDDFETFLRFAQHLIDDGDPQNYGARLAGKRLHFIEVVNDLVVPNAVPRNPPAGEDGHNPALHRVTVEGPLSGSTPLIHTIGLDIVTVEDVEEGEPIVRFGPDAPAAVRFVQGGHASVLTPPGSPVTQEMQNQIVNFLASEGGCLPIRASCETQ